MFRHRNRLEENALAKIILKWTIRKRRERGKSKTGRHDGINEENIKLARNLNSGTCEDRKEWELDTDRQR